ncbi:hypothetical protein K438DRAFT_1112840 [Mycena galopus ATCC 62051]|nr:hypothetical protein K438DRAFT_1112840 [Mycena galopus ATCC 62051]
MSKHRNPPAVHSLTINGGQGGAGGAGQAAGGNGGAGGAGTGPTVNYKIRTKLFVANYMTPSVPSDFRFIPLGDIDLLHEIRMDEYAGFVNYRSEQARVRRVYSAKVEGRKSSVAVAMYQGAGAEEEWRKDVAKYGTVRHPNLVQVWGTASMGNIHATIFHDDLIPLEDVFDLCNGSHLATVYLHAYWV